MIKVNRAFSEKVIASKHSPSLRVNVASCMKWLSLVTLVSLLTHQGLRAAAAREWTYEKGRKVTATFEGLKDGKVNLAMKNGKVLPFPLKSLSKTDQQWV